MYLGKDCGNMCDVKNVVLGIVDNIERMSIEQKEKFKEFLTKSDYFTAPLTTEYEYSYEGGLAQYGIDVLNTMWELYDTNRFDKIKLNDYNFEILALFHSLYKVNYFEKYAKNVKLYVNNGANFDEFGNYMWKSEVGYKVKDAKDRFTTGSSGLTSYMILKNFLPLSDEEALAIIHFNYDVSTKDFYELVKCNPLISFLSTSISLTLNCISRDKGVSNE